MKAILFSFLTVLLISLTSGAEVPGGDPNGEQNKGPDTAAGVNAPGCYDCRLYVSDGSLVEKPDLNKYNNLLDGGSGDPITGDKSSEGTH